MPIIKTHPQKKKLNCIATDDFNKISPDIHFENQQQKASKK